MTLGPKFLSTVFVSFALCLAPNSGTSQLLPPSDPPTHVVLGTVSEIYVAKDQQAERNQLRDPEVYFPVACLAKIVIDKVETGKDLTDAKIVYASFREWKGEVVVLRRAGDRRAHPIPVKGSAYRVILRQEKDRDLSAVHFEALQQEKQ